jgi:hypothetical protein
MKHEVMCYFDDMENIGSSTGLSHMWHESWEKYGWSPMVSNYSWLKDHPASDQMIAHVKTLPTINPRNYEESCYLRWLPAQTSNARLFTDMDTICNGLKPEDLEKLDQSKVNVLIKGGCPAAVYAPACFPFYEWILKYTKDHAIQENGQPHCSDQSMFIWLVQNKKDVFVDVDLCKEYGDKGWDFSPLIHFATGSVARFGDGKNKREVIKQWLDYKGYSIKANA